MEPEKVYIFTGAGLNGEVFRDFRAIKVGTVLLQFLALLLYFVHNQKRFTTSYSTTLFAGKCMWRNLRNSATLG
jgi:hypothetical protein